ncbi:MAG: hypothetical protein OHK0047_16720 [Leptolyngbyaceae cyanobacterium]
MQEGPASVEPLMGKEPNWYRVEGNYWALKVAAAVPAFGHNSQLAPIANWRSPVPRSNPTDWILEPLNLDDFRFAPLT